MPLNLAVKPSRTDPQPLVIYHGHCPDGFAAALAAWIYFEGQAEFLPLDHGDVCTQEQLPTLVGRAVYVLDFSVAPALLAAIEAQVAKLVLLDHHQSAAEQFVGYSCKRGVVHFDLTRSGAHLAWAFFLPERPLPDLVRYVEDRDLWLWCYPQSAGFLAALDVEPFDFARWHTLSELHGDALAAFIARGNAMDEKFQQLCRSMVDNAQSLQFNGISGLMLNAPSLFHSSLGDLLSQRSGTFALLWTVEKPGRVKCGLRSQRHFSCITLASSMGGGGHAQACGFRMPVERLPQLLSGVLTA